MVFFSFFGHTQVNFEKMNQILQKNVKKKRFAERIRGFQTVKRLNTEKHCYSPYSLCYPYLIPDCATLFHHLHSLIFPILVLYHFYQKLSSCSTAASYVCQIQKRLDIFQYQIPIKPRLKLSKIEHNHDIVQSIQSTNCLII